MPRPLDLMGFSMPPGLSALLGNEPQALTATGSTQATAAPIKSHLVSMTATGADGVILPANANVGTPYYIANVSGSTGLIYAPVGTTLNGSASTSGLSMITNKTVIFIQMSKGVWVSIPLAP